MTNKDLSIGVMTDPEDWSTYTEVATVTIKDETFQEYTVFFENYIGRGHYIAIRYNSNTSGYIFVDDVTIDYAPNCRIPKDLEATVESDSQVTLTWTAGNNETVWNVQYKKTTENDWSELITVNSTTCSITGLNRGTDYEARVQANCSAEEQSEWTEVSFITDCGIWPIDAENALFENFDDMDADFPPTCWSLQPNYNGWGINFNNAMVNDQPEPHGAAHSGMMSNGLVFLILPPMHIEGNATLSFDQLFGTTGEATESSIAVTTLNGSFDEFTPVIWTADENNLPTTRTHVSVSLANYDGRDIQVAFKYDGNTTSSRTWYIDNIKVEVSAGDNQTIELSQGWNWVSANMEITLDDLQAALVEALPGTNITIKGQAGNTRYIPNSGNWVGQLTADKFDVALMYMISVASAAEITLEGLPINLAEHEVYIPAKGSVWIAFPLSESATLNSFFTGFGISGDVVKGQHGSARFTGTSWVGQLSTLEPGQGYIFTSNASEDRILTFPTSPDKSLK